MTRRYGTIAAFAVLLALVVAPGSHAQVSNTRTVPGLFEATFAPRVATGSTTAIDITQYGIVSHALTFMVRGAPSALDVSLDCSPDNETSWSTLGSSTNASGATITATGICTHVRFTVTTLTGGTSPAVVAVYGGTPQLGSGGASGGGGGGGGDVTIVEGGATAQVTATSGGALQVECVGGTCSASGSTPYDHGEAIILASSNGLLTGGRVSAAAPSTTGVADTDWAALWVKNTGELMIGGSGVAGTAAANVLTVQGIASMTPILATVTANNLDIQSGGLDLLTQTTGALILTSANFAAAYGTAGVADTQVMTVQGIASMTPILVTSTVTTFPDNEPINVAQMNGVAVSMGSGATGTGVQRVINATDDPGVVSLGLLDNAVAGNELQVDVLTMPTVTITDGAGAINVICDSGCTGGAGGGTSQADNSAITTITGIGALFDATPPTITDGFVGLPRMDSTRYLYVVFPSAQAVSATNLDVQIGGSDSLVIGTFPDNEPINVAQFGGNAASVATTQGDDVAATTDGLWTSSFLYALDGATFDRVTSTSGALNINSELLAAQALADDTANPTIPWVGSFNMCWDSTNTNWDRCVTGPAVGVRYSSAGATEDKHVVCTGPCTLYSIVATNTNAAARYLRCENDTNANTTAGGETPELDLAIPGNAAGSGFVISYPEGKAFTVAATCWVVTGAADTDVAEVAANEIKLDYTRR